MGFRTRKDGRVYPFDDNAKEYRKDYTIYDEEQKKEKFEADSKNPKPSMGTKANANQDIKQLASQATYLNRINNEVEYDSKQARKNFRRYNRNTSDTLDKQFRRIDHKAKKRVKKSEKRKEKRINQFKSMEPDTTEGKE